MACLSIKYYCGTLKCENTYTDSLLWSMMNESALIIGSKLNPFLLWRWVIQVGLLRSDAQLMICPQFLPEFSWSCFSWWDPSGSARRKIAAKRPLDFSQTNYHLNWGFPHVFFFFIAYLILSVSISLVKIISISADNDFSPLSKYIFKRNLFMKYVCKYKNRPYMYIYNWKDLKELFPSDFWVIL